MTRELMPAYRAPPRINLHVKKFSGVLPITLMRNLVVEDDAFIRMDVVEMLREATFNILEAASADEARYQTNLDR